MANGKRYQVGRMVVRAPIGSAEMAVLRAPDEPASSRPNPSRKTGATAEPNVVHPMTPRLEARRGR